jgi:hypothetical protein
MLQILNPPTPGILKMTNNLPLDQMTLSLDQSYEGPK